MEFYKRMQATMLIVIMFCMMCVSTVLAREAKCADSGQAEADKYIACDTYGRFHQP